MAHFPASSRLSFRLHLGQPLEREDDPRPDRGGSGFPAEDGAPIEAKSASERRLAEPMLRAKRAEFLWRHPHYMGIESGKYLPT